MFNQNYVYPFLNNYANSITNMNLLNQQDLYRNSTMPSLFTPAVGLDNGNMFSELKHFLKLKISQTIEKWLFFCQILIFYIAYIFRKVYNVVMVIRYEI